VLLDPAFFLTADHCSNVATVIQKQESPFSGFIVNFHVFLKPHGIEGPHLPIHQKGTYLGFPSQEVIQTQYMPAVTGGRLQALVYSISKMTLSWGRRLFASDVGFVFCTALSDHNLHGILTMLTWSYCVMAVMTIHQTAISFFGLMGLNGYK
jgi:hypothetical protein